MLRDPSFLVYDRAAPKPELWSHSEQSHSTEARDLENQGAKRNPVPVEWQGVCFLGMASSRGSFIHLFSAHFFPKHPTGARHWRPQGLVHGPQAL